MINEAEAKAVETNAGISSEKQVDVGGHQRFPIRPDSIDYYTGRRQTCAGRRVHVESMVKTKEKDERRREQTTNHIQILSHSVRQAKTSLASPLLRRVALPPLPSSFISLSTSGQRPDLFLLFLDHAFLPSSPATGFLSLASSPRFLLVPPEGCGSVAGSLLPPASHVATQLECLFGTRLRCCLADSPAVLLSFSLLMSPFTEPWDFLESHRGNGRELGFGLSLGFQRFSEKACEKRFPTVEIVQNKLRQNYGDEAA